MRKREFGTKYSFDLAALGFGGRFGLSQLTSAQAPPSSFPPLDAKPASLIKNNEHEYLVELSRNFHSLVNDSPFYLRPLKPPKQAIERYADIVAEQNEKAAKGKSKTWPPNDQWPIDWNRFPLELRPAWFRSAEDGSNTATAVTSAPAVSKPKAKDKKKAAQLSDSADDVIGAPTQKKRRLRVKEEEVDEETIQKRLTALEQLEQQPAADEDENKLLSAVNIKQELLDVEPEEEEGAEKKKANSDDEDADNADDDDEDGPAEEDFDEEVGDYGDTYFDNGEDFEDDDDNDNEGPTY